MRLLGGIATAAIALLVPATAPAAVVPLFNQSFEDPVLSLPALPGEAKSQGWVWTGPNQMGTVFERVKDPDAPHGEWVLKVFTDGSNGLGGVHSPSSDVAPNQTHTVRMMVKVPPGRPLTKAIAERNAEDKLVTDTYDAGPIHIGTGKWELVEYSRTFGPEGVKARGYWLLGGGNDPGTFYLDAYPPDMESAPKPPADDAPAPPMLPLADPAPTVTSFGVSNRVFAPVARKAKAKKRSKRARRSAKGPKRGTTFGFILSERARVKITIEPAGRRVKAGFAPAATLRGNRSPGRHSIRFDGWVGNQPLKPGRYVAEIIATDSSDQHSSPRRVSFRVVRG